MHEVGVRPFAPGDAEAFSALNVRWLTAYFQVEPKDTATLSNPVGAILQPGGRIFMADLGDKTVGCIALLPMPGGEYEVAKMAVSPEAQGQGIGRKLLAAAVGWAREQGAAVSGKQYPFDTCPAAVRVGGISAPCGRRASGLSLCPRRRVYGNVKIK